MSQYLCRACGIVLERGGACPVCAGILAPASVAAAGECPNCGLEFAAEPSRCPLCQGPELRRGAGSPAPPPEQPAGRPGRLMPHELPFPVHRSPRRRMLWPSLVTVGLLIGAELMTDFLPGMRVPTAGEDPQPSGARALSATPARPEPPLVSPQDAERFNQRGIDLARAGDVDGAILQFTQAIAADPRNHKSHNNLGVLYRRKGFIEQAISAYRTASEIAPSDPIPYKNLAILYEEAAGSREALHYYTKYLELAPAARDAGIIRARVAGLRERAGEERLSRLRQEAPDHAVPARLGG